MLNDERDAEAVSDGERGLLLQRAVVVGAGARRERLEAEERTHGDGRGLAAGSRRFGGRGVTLARLWKTLRLLWDTVTFKMSLEQMLTAVWGSGRMTKSSP